MNGKITRREVLQLVGGSALGLLLSPIPWKVLDDTANWTQNWPWMPRPLRGDISYRYSSCTLCQASCGIRVRTVGPQPVSVSGTKQHPLSSGTLCTTGILAHHLRYHPARVKSAVKFEADGTIASGQRTIPATLKEIGAMLKQAPSVVILDSRAGRTVSGLYRELSSAAPNARYIPRSAGCLDALTILSGNATLEAGYDLNNAGLILSFGAPLFDGWGSPARTSRYLAKRNMQRLIQVEPVRSRTAEIAGQWIASRPGSDTAFALAIAHLMLEERMVQASALNAITDINEFAVFLGPYTPEQVSKTTGVSAVLIRETARAFASTHPSVAITAQDADPDTRAAAMILNILAGSLQTAGGIILRDEIPSDRSASAMKSQDSLLDEIPDHSVTAFILDESLSGSPIPDAVIRKKLVAGHGVIISLSPFVTPRPFAVQYVIPSTVMFETLTDITGPADVPHASLALSSALLPSPEGSMDALQFALKLAEAMGAALLSTGTSEELIKKRVAAIHTSGRGSVFNASAGTSQEMKELASADDLWNALTEGGCWIDSLTAPSSPLSFRVMSSLNTVSAQPVQPKDQSGLVVYPIAETSAYEGTPVSPLMSKLSQESGLRIGVHQAYINPATAAAHQVVHGETIALHTTGGTMNVQARIDTRTMPDVIFVSGSVEHSTSPGLQTVNDIRLLCEVSANGSSSPTPVTIQKVNL